MADENLLADGTVDWSLGQDAWTEPDGLQPTQYAIGVNVSGRGKSLGPRSGYHKIPLDFSDVKLRSEFGYLYTIESLWKTGKFQAFIYQPIASKEFVITVISGLIFRAEIGVWKASLMSEKIFASQRHDRLNWSYAEDAIILLDSPNQNIIIEGSQVRRANPNHTIGGDPAPEVPIATIAAYNQNRVFVGRGITLTAGDPAGSPATPEAPLTFTEVFVPNTPFYEQEASLPTDSSDTITAMGFIQQLDSSTGVGPLFVSTGTKVFFAKTDEPRINWTNGQFMGTLLANAGISGARAFVNVNSDLVFSSSEGKVYALSNARSEYRKWGHTPISREVENFLPSPEPELRKLAVLGYFANRIFITAYPYRCQALDRSRRPVTDYAHGGFVVLEIEKLATFLREGSPVWAGLWTGIDPMDMVNAGGKRCFIMAKNGGTNELYELKPDSTFDIIDGRKRYIRSIVETREYNFQNDFLYKKEHNASLDLKNLAGKVSIRLERKPRGSQNFMLWGNWKQEIKVESKEITDDAPYGYVPLGSQTVIFGDPEEVGFNPATGDSYTTFLATQLRVIIEAENWTLKNVRVQARPHDMLERPGEQQLTVVPLVPAQANIYWNLPEETLCP